LESSEWTDDQLLRLLPHIPLLHHLTVDNNRQITDKSFQHIPQHCQQLTSIRIFGPRLTQKSFSALGHHAHQLTDFNWQVSERQDPELLERLIPCTALKRLRITSDSVHLNQKTMTIIKTFEPLTSLDINFPLSDNFVAFLLAPLSLWPHLTTLYLNPCNDLDDTTWIDMIKLHSHLDKIDLIYAGKLTDISLDAMSAGLGFLKHLCIIGNINFSVNGIHRLVQDSASSSLTSVKLFDCGRNVGNQFPKSLLSFGTSVNLDRKEIEIIKQEKV
jgi:hypothetical protein